MQVAKKQRTDNRRLPCHSPINIPWETLSLIFAYCEVRDLLVRSEHPFSTDSASNAELPTSFPFRHFKLDHARVCSKWAHVAIPLGWSNIELTTRSPRIPYLVRTLTAPLRRFDYASYARTATLQISGTDREVYGVSAAQLLSIVKQLRNLVNLRVVVDSFEPLGAPPGLDSGRTTSFLLALNISWMWQLPLPCPSKVFAITLSGCLLHGEDLERIAERFGPVLDTFQAFHTGGVAGGVSVQSVGFLCRKSPRLRVLAANIVYDGEILDVIAESNKALQSLGLHFKTENGGGLAAWGAGIPVGVPAAGFVGAAGGGGPDAAPNPVAGENEAAPLPVAAPPPVLAPPAPMPMAMAAAFDMIGVNAPVGVPAIALPPPAPFTSNTVPFVPSLECLLRSPIRLTSIKLSGLSIPDGDGTRILATIATHCHGLQRLQMTAVREENLGGMIDEARALSSLRVLVLSLTTIAPRFIRLCAASCPHLQEVRAEGTPIDDTCIRELALRCPKLSALNVALCTRLTCAALVGIIQHGSGQLQVLDVSYCWQILRAPDPLRFFLWLIEDNRGLRKLAVMFKPFGVVTSKAIQRLTERFEVCEESRVPQDAEGARAFVHVVVGSRWLDVDAIRKSWAAYPAGVRRMKPWWRRLLDLLLRADPTEEQLLSGWLDA
ncbi:hypothetical protein BDK51DRAFT_38684 [Blyttiomyces helicus]|uniref:F-box domain-containing protein n=1 Tax=Blyttiomyces helicus TaxID=388810 RepID=A0A4P9WNR3_9FUNG|nr:hypothetical protein BDK51DRAFT_38684 [Blyttiomyces helicus]|eukprot:RKO94132.1 hypothetical protein BDK51DRAFT_38684 [Blyttiomyces helicus]